MRDLVIRNKNIIIELLKAGEDLKKISIVHNLNQDNLTKKILTLAKKGNIPLEKKDLRNMPHNRSGKGHEVITAVAPPPIIYSWNDLQKVLHKSKKQPFFLLLNKISYPDNLGLIIRTAFGANVDGIFFQGQEENIINEETIHLSMGTILRTVLVKMNIFSALKEFKKSGIKSYALDMRGTYYFKSNLKGAVALVLGNEGEGLSENVIKHCDDVISIPMASNLDSLNVGASAAITMYEKVRQEAQSKQ